MKKIIDENKRRKSISITIDNQLNDFLEETTSNKSRYISWLVIEKLKDLNIDISRIKL